MPFPLGPTPAHYAICSTETMTPRGVIYQGDNIAISVSQATPTHYTVRNLRGDVEVDADIPGTQPPALNFSSDLALGTIGWFSGSPTPDTGAAFTAGAGTTEFAQNLFTNVFGAGVPAYNPIRSSYLQLATTAGQQFATTLPGAQGWNAGVMFIKSAVGHNANVVRMVAGFASPPTDRHSASITVAVPATAPGNLLAVMVSSANGVGAGVADGAGNAWSTRLANVGGMSGYTTSAASPGSITSVTVTPVGDGDIWGFTFFEISGANNTSPIDVAAAQSGFGAFAAASVTPPSTTIHLTAPLGGWALGWHRIYLSGISTDTVFGPSYGAYNFCVFRDDARFPHIPIGVYGHGGEARDPVMKGCLGLGPSRLIITNPASPSTGGDLAGCELDAVLFANYWSDPGAPYADSQRPRQMFSALDFAAVDALAWPGPGGNYLGFYGADGTIDTAKVFVTVDPGTTKANKITISYPDAVTPVEVYDDLPDAATAVAQINGISAYVWVALAGATTGTTGAATAIGGTRRAGMISIVQALYPLGVTHFEGPLNEPQPTAVLAHLMRVFQGTVRAGNASAKAIGPCIADLPFDNPGGFWSVGGGDYCDEITFHAYSAILGDLNQMRRALDIMVATLTKYGVQNKPIWVTEGNYVGQGVAPFSSGGTFQPRTAASSMLAVLVFEQYGIPRERNALWYDVSHGFWNIPWWLENADGSLNPICALMRVLAEETFGFGPIPDTILDFGVLGNHIYLGSIYRAPDTSGVAVLVSQSFMYQGQSVTLTVTGGAASLVVCDEAGNLATVGVTAGRAVIPVCEFPTYVRLPVGINASVHSCNDWPAVNEAGQGSDSAYVATPFTNGELGIGLPVGNVNDGLFMTTAGTYNGALFYEITHNDGVSLGLPNTIQLTWPTAARFDRLVVFGGGPGGAASSPLHFDIDTSIDGMTWVTRKTIDVRGTAISFAHGTDSTNEGLARESFWPRQWVYDERLSEPVVAKAVRIHVYEATFGSQPDRAGHINAQDFQEQHVFVTEIMVSCDHNVTPQFVTLDA